MVNSSIRLLCICLVVHVFLAKNGGGGPSVAPFFSDLPTSRAPSSLQWLVVKVVKVST